MKTPEGAKMLKTSQKTEEGEEELDVIEEVGGLELQESKDGKSETVDEEKGAED